MADIPNFTHFANSAALTFVSFLTEFLKYCYQIQFAVSSESTFQVYCSNVCKPSDSFSD